MQMDDSRATGAVLSGDRDQYGVLVDKCKKMVYAIAWSHLGDSDLSEDVAQETFIKAYSYLGTLHNSDAFSGWLARIARSVCGTFGRRIKREHGFTQRLGILESAEAPAVEEPATHRHQRRVTIFATATMAIALAMMVAIQFLIKD